MKVEGTLSIQNPAVVPFSHNCTKCKNSNLLVLDDGFYCNICHHVRSVFKKASLSGKIVTFSENVFVTIEGQWLASLVGMSETQFLNLTRGEQILMLSSFRVRGIFALTFTNYLCGFTERMEVAANPSSDASTSLVQEFSPSLIEGQTAAHDGDNASKKRKMEDNETLVSSEN